MKPYKVIGNYCRLYGVAMPEIDYSETQFFVAISSGGARVMRFCTPSKLLGRVVCEAMKRGTVLYVHNGWANVLTWEDWKKTWIKLFTPKKRNNAPEPNKIHPYKSEIFETMQQPRRYKKPQKHGFERTFSANINMNRLSGCLDGIRVEHI